MKIGCFSGRIRKGYTPRLLILFSFIVLITSGTFGQISESVIGAGWAGNTVNTAVFRRNSIVSDAQWQYVAYYDASRFVVLAKRRHGSNNWEIKQTRYKGNIYDAHNSISIMLDGDGYLHVSWDHHGNALNYCKSVAPGSLELTDKLTMTGRNETAVTYPEFYKLPDGDLLMLYRDGASGSGNLVLNRYHTRQKRWSRVHKNLIDGEGKRNAYWQACVDNQGVFHLSWVWRENPDVSSNHDMCYARSIDGGRTWEKSYGAGQTIPINTHNAEYVLAVSRRSDLINSTSMVADANGRPYIATYFRPQGDSTPQYHLIYFTGNAWKLRQVTNRRQPFTLSGGGTRRIPISRPQILAQGTKVYIIYRDAERGNRMSVTYTDNVSNENWKTIDLTHSPVGQSEPSFDTELWRREHILHLFVQFTGQGDGEATEDIPPQPVRVLEWKPL